MNRRLRACSCSSGPVLDGQFGPGIGGRRLPRRRTTPSRPTQPMPPAEAAPAFRVPEGFRVTVFAAEPDVRNPIAMAWDRRGRLWVAENYTYAERPQKFDLRLRDRVLIFEDTDGDGRFDRAHGLHRRGRSGSPASRSASAASGCSARRSCCSSPTATATTCPTAPPRSCSTASPSRPRTTTTSPTACSWGPDGWLYGRCGASAPGPGRRPRARPTRGRVPLRRRHLAVSTRSARRFEVLAHGTTNPWGHDWDEHGEVFFINTVNGHLWHAVPGDALRPARTRSTPTRASTR